jgi:hypothetical protein
MIEKTDLWAWLWATLDALGGIAVEYEEENRQLKETIERLRALAANRPDREAKAEELAAEPPLMDFANIRSSPSCARWSPAACPAGRDRSCALALALTCWAYDTAPRCPCASSGWQHEGVQP